MSLLSPDQTAPLDAFGALLEAMARLTKVFDRSLRERVGLTTSWFEALLRIERSGGRMTMGELANQVVLTTGGVTRLIDRMETEGLVCRELCAEDRRVSYAAITERGREVLGRAVEVHIQDLEDHFLGRMTEPEREVLVSVMDRIRSEESCR
jgi:MarR family 2-MHQ and catechol resistance regulon transcriptional repressor